MAKKDKKVSNAETELQKGKTTEKSKKDSKGKKNDGKGKKDQKKKPHKVLQFFKDCFKEIKKIVWPGGKSVFKNTVVVIVVVAVCGAIIYGFDFGMSSALKAVKNAAPTTTTSASTTTPASAETTTQAASQTSTTSK